MPINNFLIFDQNKANMIGDEAYKTSTQRLNGVQSGVASSMLNNKFAYQVSLVAYAIAQVMNANGIDATDTMAVSQFVNNLSSTFLQKVVDKASVAEAVAASSDSKWMSPKTVKSFVENFDNNKKISIFVVQSYNSSKPESITLTVDNRYDILAAILGIVYNYNSTSEVSKVQTIVDVEGAAAEIHDSYPYLFDIVISKNTLTGTPAISSSKTNLFNIKGIIIGKLR